VKDEGGRVESTPAALGTTAGEGPAGELRRRLGQEAVREQPTCDGVPTLWIAPGHLIDAARLLKEEVDRPYRMLYDLTAVDERQRSVSRPPEAADFTVVYHLLSFDRNADVRLKVALREDDLAVPSLTGLFRNADWYEREVWDMFGIGFAGHPNLRRILMPETWQGHPLRKDHPARATEMGPYQLPRDKQEHELEALRFAPEKWGLQRRDGDTEFMFLNVGPQHPGTHGVLRIVLQLDGEKIVDAVPQIGFHHRGAEKMGERQSWHSYIPYTDRVDYLGGVMNNLPYVLAVERLCGIEVPERARVIRVMLCELFRLSSHLVWFGTYAQDVGALSPVFYMFNDRERIFDIVEAITGARMHPGWFRIGGVAQDLPQGWDELVRAYLDYMPGRLRDYDGMVMKNGLFQARTRGIGAYTLEDAIEWGVTGPGLRACGLEWDFRRKRPYGSYEWFDFEVPTATAGDGYARAEVRLQEMYQSLHIVRQCLDNMPAGPIKSDHPLTTPPPRQGTMQDIETLINHFLNVTWGPVVPPGESFQGIEATKGNNGYYLISDGGVHAYRVRIRAPTFPHMQMLPAITRGLLVPDLLSILGSIDFVLADVDR
jgi:NADH-quinone oxidoreductase subunit C/D